MPRCLASRQGKYNPASAYLFLRKGRGYESLLIGCAEASDFSLIYNLEEKTVAEKNPEYKTIVLTRRLKTPGVLETMSEQVPEVMEAFADIHTKLIQRIEMLGEGDWHVVSHSHSIYNGILVVSYMVSS